MDLTRPTPATLAEIERQWEELHTQADLPSQHATGPADPDPASPPITALSTPKPLPPSPGPTQHTLKSVFEQFALYGLAGEAVRTLAPHTEAQPEAILLQLLAAFGNILGPRPHCMSAPPATP